MQYKYKHLRKLLNLVIKCGKGLSESSSVTDIQKENYDLLSKSMIEDFYKELNKPGRSKNRI